MVINLSNENLEDQQKHLVRLEREVEKLKKQIAQYQKAKKRKVRQRTDSNSVLVDNPDQITASGVCNIRFHQQQGNRGRTYLSINGLNPEVIQLISKFSDPTDHNGLCFTVNLEQLKGLGKKGSSFEAYLSEDYRKAMDRQQPSDQQFRKLNHTSSLVLAINITKNLKLKFQNLLVSYKIGIDKQHLQKSFCKFVVIRKIK